jgi:hypothetical protein
MSNLYRTQTAEPARWSLLKEMADPDLQCVALSFALGLLITCYVMIRYPQLGAIIAQYSQI